MATAEAREIERLRMADGERIVCVFDLMTGFFEFWESGFGVLEYSVFLCIFWLICYFSFVEVLRS